MLFLPTDKSTSEARADEQFQARRIVERSTASQIARHAKLARLVSEKPRIKD